MNPDSLLTEATNGSSSAWNQLVETHSQRVRRMVEVRMDQRLKARVDPSDVLQDVFLDAWRRLDEFQSAESMPFFLWLRLLTGQRLISLHRHHFGVEKRNASREQRRTRPFPGASSVSLAGYLVSEVASPSSAAIQEEQVEQLRQALECLSEEERELLTLRHFEHLSNVEAAQIMGMNESTASTRYLRAVRKLKGILEKIPGFLDDA